MDVSRHSLGNQSLTISSGFSLIEVLITLFITSVGLLSLAALQIHGLRFTHSSILRTHAVAYATETVEQLYTAAPASTAEPPAHCLSALTR